MSQAQKALSLLAEKDSSLMKKYQHLIIENAESSGSSLSFEQTATLVRLFENQGLEVRAIANELNESMDSTNVATFNKYVLSMIRRIYPTLPINDLVGIQALTGPVGQIFTMEAKYSTAKAPLAAGTTIYNNATKSYASQAVEGETWKAAGSSTTSYSGTLGWKPVVPGTLTVTINTVVGVDDGAGAITGTGIATGTIDYVTGAIAITLDSASTSAGTATYEYNNELNTQVPEVEMVITSKSVHVENRKLRATWSPEYQQDLERVHGIQGEAVIISEITNSIQREISRAVVEQVRSIVPSGHKKSWALTRPAEISYDDHKRTFVDTIVAASRIIGNATRRGKGNVLVVSNDGSDIIETLPGYRPDSAETSIRVGGRLGTLNNRWTVLEDIDMDATKALVAYKGPSFLDTGVVYSPYTAVMLRTVELADDFKARKGFMTRDAITSVNPNFYAEVSITGTKVYT